jgi:hypothetical protein
MSNRDEIRAFGRDGYILEGLRDAGRGFGRPTGFVLRAVAIGFLIIVAWHVVPALAAKDSPPAACSLLGGTWNLWSGWTCG